MVRRKPVKSKPDNAEPDEPPEPISTSSPQTGLVPFGNSPFYHTPDEPADPRDCNRYPSSIYCGENPFKNPFKDSPVSIEPAIVVDECNLGIELTPVLGYVTLPPVQIVYRRPGLECKEKPLPKPPPPIGTFYPFNSPIKDNCLYRVDIETTGPGYANPETASKYTDDYIPVKYIHISQCWSPIIGLSSKQYFGGDLSPFTGNYIDDASTGYQTEDGSFEFMRIDLQQHFIYCKYREISSGTQQYQLDMPIAEYIENYLNSNLRDIESRYKTIKNVQKLRVFGAAPGCEGWSIKRAKNFFAPPRIVGIHEIWCPPSDFAPLFPPPPPLIKKCDCAMTCCPDVTQNEDLIKSLIKKVDKLSEVVGVDDYPVSLPSSLLSRDEGFLGNIIPNFNEDVPSLTRFLAWYVERFDEIMGQWEIPIEIKDSDPSKPGDQPLGVKLPNMAEAIAEMFTLIFQTNLNSETLLNFAVRTAAENATDKQQNFITYKLMQSMAEWAGYKQKDINLKMPLLFSLGKTRYDEILKESEVEVPCVDFDEKFGLEADLMRFREAVSILQATYKRKVNPGGDIKAEILKHLLDTFASVNKVNDENDDEDFKKFLAEVEDGFIHTPGAKETTEPYGRPYKERPKIRDLTNPNPPNPPNP